MADLPALMATPRDLVVAGETFRIHPLTLADFAELQVWIDAQYPDPFEVAGRALESGRFNVAQQKHILQIATETACKARPKLGTPEADELAYSVDGICELLTLAVRKGRPDFDRAKARAVFDKMGLGDIRKLFTVTEADKVVNDPKAPTPPGSTGPTTP